MKKNVTEKKNECHVTVITSRQDVCWTASPGKQHVVNVGFLFDAHMQAQARHCKLQGFQEWTETKRKTKNETESARNNAV